MTYLDILEQRTELKESEMDSPVCLRQIKKLRSGKREPYNKKKDGTERERKRTECSRPASHPTSYTYRKLRNATLQRVILDYCGGSLHSRPHLT